MSRGKNVFGHHKLWTDVDETEQLSGNAETQLRKKEVARVDSTLSF